MIKKFVRHGNSYALVVDKPILELAKIDPENCEVEIRLNDGDIVLHPISTEERSIFQEALRRTNERYAEMLQRLAQ